MRWGNNAPGLKIGETKLVNASGALKVMYACKVHKGFATKLYPFQH